MFVIIYFASDKRLLILLLCCCYHGLLNFHIFVNKERVLILDYFVPNTLIKKTCLNAYDNPRNLIIIV